MNNKMIIQIPKNKGLTPEEKSLIDRLNATLSLLKDSERYSEFIKHLDQTVATIEESSDNSQQLLKEIYIVDFAIILQYFDEIEVVQTDFNSISFEQNVNIYEINEILERNVMPIDVFKRFISENKISTIFKSTNSNSFVQTGLFEDDVSNFINNANLIYFIHDIYEDAIERDLKIFNSILGKANQSTCYNETYLCNYNGLIITAKNNAELSDIPANILVGLIYFQNVEKIINNFIKLIKDKKAQQEANQKEYELRKKEKLAQIKKQIINDPAFKKSTSSKMREGYLKALFKNESDEVLSFLDMSRRYNGTIIFNGITAQLFINEIWEELTNSI